LIGTPSADKKALTFDTAHDVSEQRSDLIREVLAWLGGSTFRSSVRGSLSGRVPVYGLSPKPARSKTSNIVPLGGHPLALESRVLVKWDPAETKPGSTSLIWR
jgi:hypothetical protein